MGCASSAPLVQQGLDAARKAVSKGASNSVDDKVKSVGNDAVESAEQQSKGIMESVSHVKDEVMGKIEDFGENIKEKVGDTIEDIEEKVESMMGIHKDKKEDEEVAEESEDMKDAVDSIDQMIETEEGDAKDQVEESLETIDITSNSYEDKKREVDSIGSAATTADAASVQGTNSPVEMLSPTRFSEWADVKNRTDLEFDNSVELQETNGEPQDYPNGSFGEVNRDISNKRDRQFTAEISSIDDSYLNTNAEETTMPAERNILEGRNSLAEGESNAIETEGLHDDGAQEQAAILTELDDLPNDTNFLQLDSLSEQARSFQVLKENEMVVRDLNVENEESNLSTATSDTNNLDKSSDKQPTEINLREGMKETLIKHVEHLDGAKLQLTKIDASSKINCFDEDAQDKVSSDSLNEDYNKIVESGN